VGRVLGIDLSALRLEAARTLGAEALDGSPGVPEALDAALSDTDEIDVVFECSGVRRSRTLRCNGFGPGAPSWCSPSTTTP
jgi:threonine dehydrogenase-like Zn-dependent dehydrogenase